MSTLVSTGGVSPFSNLRASEGYSRLAKIPAAIILALTSGVMPVLSGLCSPNSMIAMTNVRGAASREQVARTSLNLESHVD